MAYERGTLFYVTNDGTRHIKKPDSYVLTYQTLENDGARFMRRGPERHLRVSLAGEPKQSELEDLVESGKLPEIISERLRAMVFQSKIQKYFDVYLND